MNLLSFTLKGMLSRKVSTVLLIGSIALSTLLLVGVQKIKWSAKQSFSHSISGTDLIVGARSGDIQLLLYTVFRQGQPVANMSWDSVQAIQAFPEVDWVVPISLGDSFKGFPVMGTVPTYFTHYRYGKKQALKIKTGRVFQHPFDVVLGHKVARKLTVAIGDTIYLSHGMAKGYVPVHKDTPFTVVGVLEPTGTPVDKTVHIPLEGMHALHVPPVEREALRTGQPELYSSLDAMSVSVTGSFIGLASKFSLFSVKNRIVNMSSEPLMAIIPGVSLSRLWKTIQPMDTAFLVITLFVLVIAFFSLLLALLMSLQQRKRELIICRALGARPSQLCGILVLESFFVSVIGVCIGLAMMWTLGWVMAPFLEASLGLVLSLYRFSVPELMLSIGIVIFGVCISVVPCVMVYRERHMLGASSW